LTELDRLRQSQLREVRELQSIEAERERVLATFRSQEERALSGLDSLDLDGARMQALVSDLESTRVAAAPPVAVTGRGGEAPFTDLGAVHAGTLDWPADGEILYRFGVETRP